jgi:hypothetical protein
MYAIGPEPDLNYYESLSPNPRARSRYLAFAEVLKWAVPRGFAYARTTDGYFLIRGKKEVISVTRESYLDNPLQAARSVLQALKEELA